MTNKHFNALRRGCSTLAVSLVLAMGAVGTGHADTAAISFNIAPKNTAQALIDFSKQAGVQVLFPFSVASNFEAPALRGEYSADVALAKILAGTTLEVASVSDKTITLKVSEKSVEKTKVTSPKTDEVVVTGTHIRGGNPTSPVRVIGRGEIEQSGYSQIGDVMRSLPENFAGGMNPGVIAANAGGSGNGNQTNASTINLRGLGVDATLVLLNGRRLAPDGIFQGSDISGIPLAAVQRVDVMTDGASAIYGSDAIAGVVNFVLRKNYHGTQTSARLGGATQGGGTERTFSVLSGLSGPTWYGLINLERSETDKVKAKDREFTLGAVPATTLGRQQVRNSLFASAGYDLSDRVNVSMDALVSDRVVEGLTQIRPTATRYLSEWYTPSYSVGGSVNGALGKTWNVSLKGVVSGGRNTLWSRPVGLTSITNAQYRNRLAYLEVSADGTLVQLPTGTMKAAVGGGVRKETFQLGFPGPTTYVKPKRDATYLFAEVITPLVSTSEARTGLEELELSLSVRTEDFSDFGKTTDPKFGIRYVPLKGLTVRGTWGTSFKPPSFLQMYQRSPIYLYKAVDLGYVGAASDQTGLLTWGGNADLKPEVSTSWTLGADYIPANMKTAKVTLTYFDIDYTDRVVQPIANTPAGFSNPAYASFVELAPNAARQAELIALSTQLTNFASVAYNPAKVMGVLHNTYQNATSQTAKGVDLGYRQTFNLKRSTLSTFLNASWLDVKQQTTPGAAVVELTGHIFNPPDFKARGGLTWQGANTSVTAIVNHVGKSRDTGYTPNRPIGVWTTTDANLSYRFDSKGSFEGLKVALSATNLFDRDPPRALSPSVSYAGIYFDSTNASVLGRFVSLTLTKDW